MSGLTRRGFLEGALGGAACASLAGTLPRPLQAASRERVSLATTALKGNLKLITGAGANVIALAGAGASEDGALLVDGGLESRSAALTKLALKDTATRRIHTLFNTHWHPEQTGSNERAGKAGATIVAHENTKLWLARPIEVDWLEGPFGPLPPKARPSKTFYTTDRMAFGGEEIDYGYMAQAHTDGDIYVHFRKANVLAAGGVVSNAGWPLMDYRTGGWIGGLVAGYDRLLKVSDADTQVIPANGAPLTRADLDAHRKMYFTIFDRLVKLLNKGLGPEEVVTQEPAKEFVAQWGEPDAFIEACYRSLWGHYAPDA